MGPQPFGCGRTYLSSRNPVIMSLQWGRNLSVAEGAGTPPPPPAPKTFNGAATFRLRKAHGCAACYRQEYPSMGPQPFGCGRWRAQAVRADGLAPSMGPQPFGCGRDVECVCQRDLKAPSMGPQPFGCGRPRAADRPAALGTFNGAATFRLRKGRGRYSVGTPAGTILQWGRNLSVAEGAGGPLIAYKSCTLQWGRNLSVAEGRQCAAIGASRRSLQWGRNLSVAEGGRMPAAAE